MLIESVSLPNGLHFVAACECGWRSSPRATAEGAGREIDLHMAEKFPMPTERRPCGGTTGSVALITEN